MAFCTQCGNRKNEGANFCPNCGTAFAAMAPQAESPQAESSRDVGGGQEEGPSFTSLIWGIIFGLTGGVLLVIAIITPQYTWDARWQFVDNTELITALYAFGAISAVIGIGLAVSYASKKDKERK